MLGVLRGFGIPTLSIMSHHDPPTRTATLKAFTESEDDEQNRVIVLSTLLSGVGISLHQACCDMVILTSHASISALGQFMMRISRIGQDEIQRVWMPLIEDGIDVQNLSRAMRKYIPTFFTEADMTTVSEGGFASTMMYYEFQRSKFNLPYMLYNMASMDMEVFFAYKKFCKHITKHMHEIMEVSPAAKAKQRRLNWDYRNTLRVRVVAAKEANNLIRKAREKDGSFNIDGPNGVSVAVPSRGVVKPHLIPLFVEEFDLLTGRSAADGEWEETKFKFGILALMHAMVAKAWATIGNKEFGTYVDDGRRDSQDFVPQEEDEFDPDHVHAIQQAQLAKGVDKVERQRKQLRARVEDEDAQNRFDFDYLNLAGKSPIRLSDDSESSSGSGDDDGDTAMG